MTQHSQSPAGGQATDAEDKQGTRKKSRERVPEPLIVGIGASTGGEQSLLEIAQNLGDGSGMAIVFALHHSSWDWETLTQTLAEKTRLEVVILSETTKLEPQKLYLVAEGSTAEIHNGCAVVITSEDANARGTQTTVDSTPIDRLLSSLAFDQLERSVGIILSGPGSDGILGLRSISNQGGLTFVQSAETAKVDAMPRMAANCGAADHVLPPEDIGRELVRYQKHSVTLADSRSRERLQQEVVSLIPVIAQRLQQVTSHNFKHYKTTTLSRRILRRMQVLKISSPEDYVKQLDKSEQETHALFRELLIGVTCFFRDPEAFECLRDLVLPNLFEGRQQGDTVRIWVAGCATGEEAYTLAILCRECIDQLDNPPEVKIFATDIDQRALQIARQGVYSVGIEEHLGSERLERFFIRKGKQYQATKEIRDMVLFSPHNLISDPPFSKQDLICCRNLLIYLGAHLQNKLIPLFHYALRPAGYLILGPSENIASHGDLFRVLDTKHRISQRKGTAVGSAATPAIRTRGISAQNKEQNGPDSQVDLTNLMQKIILDEFAPKAVVVDESGQVLAASADMEKYLSIAGGRFQNNIVKMARSGLRIGLRVTLMQAKSSRRKVQHDNLSVKVGDNTLQVMLTVQPMPDLGEDTGLFLVVFHDVGLPFSLIDKSTSTLKDSHNDGDRSGDTHSIIAQMERELECTKEDLENTMQDMEAANEELKSSNEELISMNEELQSANEELEASKEQIRGGSNALTRVNNDLENLLRSTQIATIFLDGKLLIRSFTPSVVELYDLLPTDIGRSLSRFMPMVDNMPPLPCPESLSESEPVEHLVVAKSGKTFMRRVLPYMSRAGNREGMVITFSDVSAIRESERQAKQASLSKSEFLANMSHEIRTPMTAILGYADLLAEGETDPTKLQYFETIRRNGDFLLQIINDILDLSKIEANKVDVERALFAPHQIVEDVRSIMEVRAKEKNLNLEVRYRGKMPAKIESDPKRVKQVLINLVGNAIKFTEEGRVEVAVEFCGGEKPSLKFDVIDTGIGMTSQQKDLLFQPFSQGDSSVNRRFGGTGLGLAISRRLVNILGGTIEVESEAGKGSRFSITIATGDVSGVEFLEPKIASQAPDSVAEFEALHLACRVLVVDDRREIRFLSKSLLSKAGAEVVEAEDGEQAISLVERSVNDGLPFDLILLDMQMPKLDGYSTAEKLRLMGFKNPIVALTADAMQGDMGRCINSGCNAYLSKPIDTRKLLRLVAAFTQPPLPDASPEQQISFER